MKRLVIAIDCDDVLIDSTKYVISQYNQYYNTAVKLEGAFSINDRDFGATRTQVLELFDTAAGQYHAGARLGQRARKLRAQAAGRARDKRQPAAANNPS